MLRSILLVAVIAAAMGVYLDKRGERTARPAGPGISQPNASSPSSASTPTPLSSAPLSSAPLSSAPLSSAPVTATQSELRARSLLLRTHTLSSGDPLTAMDREQLRDALADWVAVPDELLAASHDLAGNGEVGYAAFRSLLLAGSRARLGDPPVSLRSSTVELHDGRELVLENPLRQGSSLIGHSPAGLLLSFPLRSVARTESIPPEDALAAWRKRTEARIAVLLETDDLGERRLAIELLLWLGEFERADAIYPTWIARGGPRAIVSEVASATQRIQYLNLAEALEEVALPDRGAIQAATPLHGAPPTRDLEQLRAFLSTREGIRRLENDARIARAEECTEWTEWLERRAPQLKLTTAGRRSLEEELRRFRYDLLKSTGF